MEVREPRSKRPKLKIESSSIGDLNDDLIIEILCRLPYKNVVRCKCISRNWFSLICNPQFMARFSSMNKLPWTFIYYALEFKKSREENLPKLTSSDDVFKSPGFSLRFLPFYKARRKDSRIRAVKTYNDLVLCCEANDLSKYNVYYICNPLTMQWVSLPPVPQSKCGYNCVDFTCELAKDNRKKHHEYRFKVVQVPRMTRKTEIKVQIFSSEIGRWNEISTPLPVIDGLESIHVQEAVICNNKVITLGFVLQKHGTMNINMGIFDFFNGGARFVSHYQHIFTMSRDFNCVYKFHGLHRIAQGGLRLARVLLLESQPVIKIWELREENNYEWRLMQEVYFKDILSECKWISEDYLKRTFTRKPKKDGDVELEEGYAYVPSIFGFDPNDGNILYMNLKCEGRVGKYDVQRRSLNIANHTQLTSLHNGNPMLIVLQLWPTPLPIRPTWPAVW